MSDDAEKQNKIAAIADLCTSASTCISCTLASTRTKVVFGVGNPASPLMLIGEGPGANEDAIGEPFVGRAGKLLDECMFAAGMHRRHVYLTNIVKCRASEVENGRIKNRVPAQTEIDTCVPLWLDRQVRIIKPLVILCIGAPAASTIIHKGFKISADRGKFYETSYCPRTIAALHPAYILRQEGPNYERTRESLIDDLRTAKERAIQARTEPVTTLF